MNINLLSFLTSLTVWGMVTKAFALEPFDGRPLRVDLPKDKAALLENGEPVTVEVTKQQGRALVIVRDVEAPTHICMGQIKDLRKYPAITPFLKDVDIYDDTVFANVRERDKIRDNTYLPIFPGNSSFGCKVFHASYGHECGLLHPLSPSPTS